MSEYPPATQLELIGAVKLEFDLEASGLLIRSGKAKEILGAADIQPITIRRKYEVDGKSYLLEVPYIPASSLKGRSRSLLELALNLPLYTTDGRIYLHMRVVRNSVMDADPYCPIDNVFGTPAIDAGRLSQQGLEYLFNCWAPSRAIFRDLYPSERYVQELCKSKGDCSYITLDDFVEEKWENRIDRVTSTADPRNLLRLRPGVEFSGGITFLVFDLDVCPRRECEEKSAYRDKVGGLPAKFYLETLLKGFELVEATYLGAAGTRGYGQVKFKRLKVEFRPIAPRAEGVAPPLVEGKDLAEFTAKVREWGLWNGLKGLCKS
ncbi:MAG: type III-A CRISPR-associated RAMP protein Csm3 [Pyrobaculum sp.]